MPLHAMNLSSIPGLQHGFGLSDEPQSKAAIIFANQANGAAVSQHTASPARIQSPSDSVFSQLPCCLGIATADCLPILVSSVRQPFIAVIHAGWQGLFQEIIRNSVEAYTKAGIDTRALQFAVGPHIGACCYEVSASFAETIERRHSSVWSNSTPPWSLERNISQLPAPTRAAKPYGDGLWFDLRRYATGLFQDALIRPEQITWTGHCTYCSELSLGSYRRRQHHNEAKRFQRSWICLSA